MQVKNPLAELSQSTLFDEQAGRLRPLSSHDLTVVPFKRRAVDTRYDWNSSQATAPPAAVPRVARRQSVQW